MKKILILLLFSAIALFSSTTEENLVKAKEKYNMQQNGSTFESLEGNMQNDNRFIPFVKYSSYSTFETFTSDPQRFRADSNSGNGFQCGDYASLKSSGLYFKALGVFTSQIQRISGNSSFVRKDTNEFMIDNKTAIANLDKFKCSLSDEQYRLFIVSLLLEDKVNVEKIKKMIPKLDMSTGNLYKIIINSDLTYKKITYSVTSNVFSGNFYLAKENLKKIEEILDVLDTM